MKHESIAYLFEITIQLPQIEYLKSHPQFILIFKSISVYPLR